jgi:hypothetical protein
LAPGANDTGAGGPALLLPDVPGAKGEAVVMSRRSRAATLAVAAVTAGVLALGTTPAAASGDYSGRAYVHQELGWDDEGLLSTTRHASSNATCLWQKILWADGFLTDADIDGIFGPDTRSATIAWQQWQGVNADGVVGPQTFGLAGAWGLWWDGSDLRYSGREHSALITVDGNGRYGFYENGTHRAAGYDYRTCG